MESISSNNLQSEPMKELTITNDLSVRILKVSIDWFGKHKHMMSRMKRTSYFYAFYTNMFDFCRRIIMFNMRFKGDDYEWNS